MIRSQQHCCVFLSIESIEKHAKDYYMGVGMMILVISVAFALAALLISALRSPPVVAELILVEFIPKRNDKTCIDLSSC